MAIESFYYLHQHLMIVKIIGFDYNNIYYIFCKVCKVCKVTEVYSLQKLIANKVLSVIKFICGLRKFHKKFICG